MSGVNVHFGSIMNVWSKCHFGSIMNVWSKCTLWEYNECLE